jgi:AbrB family looped-hinge helix DNA binding protein
MTELAELSIDEQGRIHLPAALQDRFGLEPGMTLILEEGEAGEMWIRPKEQPPVLVDKGGVLVVRVEPLADLGDAVRRDRAARVVSLVDRTNL